MPAKKTATRRTPGGMPVAAIEARKQRNAIARNETAEQKFKRLGTERVDATLRKLKQVKATASYPHSATAAAKIVDALETGISEVKRAFFPPMTQLTGKKGGFRLDEEDDSRT